MHHTLLIAAAAVALAIPIVIAAQGTPIDPPVRVNVITLDSTWYITGELVSITGDSVVVQRDTDGARLAFERIHVLSVQQWHRNAGVGRSALIGCAILGGTLGLLGSLPSHGGDGEFSGPVVGLAVGAAGCFVGGVIGAVVGAINTGSWRPIELPPRTGTESDTSPVLTLDSPRVYPPQTTVRFAHAVF
jgi:hypothetical protein